MQITIYLSDDLIRKIDALARKQGKSRSSLIQEALNRDLESKKSVSYPTETLSVFGAWKDLSIEQIDEFRKSFAGDVRRMKLK
ncbi:ribbon-helix-helix domain-containing protein [bacterium]|nr:ribbon-helix-helix domain-containing protein [bacterium]MCI0603511.1 ribbon-helix-helix domain-containing protein [bacterium]